jgi:hypothetical protein
VALRDTAGEPQRPVGPVFVPYRRGLEDLHSGVHRFPAAMTAPLAGAVTTLLGRLPRTGVPDRSSASATPVRPGSLGHWTDPAPEAAPDR